MVVLSRRCFCDYYIPLDKGRRVKKVVKIAQLLLICAGSLCVPYILSNDAVVLQAVTHHQASSDGHVQIGKITFHCNQKPSMKDAIKKISVNQVQHVFYFSNIVLSDSFSGTILELKKKSPLYTCSIDQKKTDRANTLGIVFTLSYDPTLVQVQYDSFDEFTKERAIVFHIFDKKLLNLLQKKNKLPILQLSCNEKRVVERFA